MQGSHGVLPQADSCIGSWVLALPSWERETGSEALRLNSRFPTARIALRFLTGPAATRAELPAEFTTANSAGSVSGYLSKPALPPTRCQRRVGGSRQAEIPLWLELHFNYRSGQPTIALDRAAANRWEPLLGYWHVISVVNAPSHYSVLFGRTKKGI